MLIGPNTGSTFVSDATIGSVSWTSPGNAAAIDGVLASAALTIGAFTKYLKATGFGFAIPPGAIIVGILVEVLQVGSLFDTINDKSIKIVKGNTISGTEKARGTNMWSGFGQMVAYGGMSDLWGLSWTPSDINDATFGAVVSAVDTFDGGSGTTVSLDCIQITVCCASSSFFGDASAPIRTADGFGSS